MKFGVCTSHSNAPAVRSAGWDFIEENVQGFLKPAEPQAVWEGPQHAKASALPILSANIMVPGSIKITGPDADVDKLAEYFIVLAGRAQQTGIRTIVFGSGGARNVPEGFSREKARDQIVDFGKTIAPIAERHGVTIVIEPLNSKECNIINSVQEAMEYVQAIDHPAMECLVDSYHFWLEKEPLENLAIAMPSIKHVHLADVDGRVAPGESGKSDYRPFFHVLKNGNYEGPIAIECKPFDISVRGKAILEYIKTQWDQA